jgi:hypothetical protein
LFHYEIHRNIVRNISSNNKTKVMKNVQLTLLAIVFLGLSASAQTAPKAPKAAKAPPASSSHKPRNFDEVEAELERAQKSLDQVELPTPPEAPEAPTFDAKEMERSLAEAERTLRTDNKLSKRETDRLRREMDRARQELARVRDVEMPRMQEEMKNAREEMGKARVEMGKARIEMEKAREEIKEYRAFETQLSEDGLIDKNKYKLEHRNGKFSINGKEQPESIYNKYRSFLDKHKKFVWKKTEEALTINDDDDDRL